MRIAIDASPTAATSGHKVRGTGFYIEHLKKTLTNSFPHESFQFFTHLNELHGEVDVIHYPYFEPFFLSLPRKHFAKKSVVTVHDLTPLVFPRHFPSGIKGKVRLLIQKNTLRSVDSIITDSEASKKDIEKLFGINSEKIHVVYLAAGDEFEKRFLSAEEKQQLRKKYNLPEKFVLYVGDATWNKNLPRLVRAIKSTDMPLVMIGKTLAEADFDKTNPWNKDLVEIEDLTRNSSQIHKLGFVPTDDLVTIYNMATVFVMPSLYEGFGLPILEAMISGCPVITSKEGSLPEVVGEAAYYVNAYSEKDIADGITKVFSDNDLQKSLVEKGLIQAKKFNWEKTAKETMNVYES